MNIPWIYEGAKVKDKFGEWVIFACPDRVDTKVGGINITVSSSDGSQRDIWLLDFLRDFEPVIELRIAVFDNGTWRAVVEEAADTIRRNNSYMGMDNEQT